MNELFDSIKLLLQFEQDSKLKVSSISSYSYLGGMYVRVILGKKVNGKSMHFAHLFYIPGGISSPKNWDNNINRMEFEYFINQAKDEKNWKIAEEQIFD